MKKIAITIALILTINNVYAEFDPNKSTFDDRVRVLNYNTDDVTKITAVDGYTTTIKFSEKENIQYVTTGFEEGWQHKIQNNYLIILPKAIDNDGQFYQPSNDWNTNLIVITDIREYSFQLEIGENKKNNSFLVKFNYPMDIAKQAKEENLRKAKEYKEKQNKELIEKSLGKLNIPVNWNYYKSVNEGSNDIEPDFVYDDGLLTFLGFRNGKEIPSVFLVNNDKTEEILPYNMRADVLNNYKTLVIHKVAEKLILRSGNRIVGIFNKSYGLFTPEYNTTTNRNVKRVIK